MAKSKHREDAGERIDEYLATLPEWSAGLCTRLRILILKSSPEIVEDWKWGPNYYYKGMVCGYAAFKQHVSFVFFQGALLKDPEKILQQNPGNLHNRHIKFSEGDKINAKILTAYIREAMKNNAAELKITKPLQKTVSIHPELATALNKAKLLVAFEAFTYYKRKELNEWVSTAKREETRVKRIAEAVAQVKAGKSIHDKYRKNK